MQAQAKSQLEDQLAGLVAGAERLQADREDGARRGRRRGAALKAEELRL